MSFESPIGNNTSFCPSTNYFIGNPATKLSLIILSFLIIATIILGNYLVLLAAWRTKRLRKQGRLYLVSLAVADAFVGLLIFPLRLYQYLQQSNFPVTTTTVYVWFDIFCATISITTLTVISVDRWFKISHPFRYNSIITTRKCAVVIAIVWFYSGMFAMLGVIPFKEEKRILVSGPSCAKMSNIDFYYSILSFALSFVIPCVILFVTYILIFYAAYHRRLCINQHNTVNPQALRTFLKDIKNAKTLLTIIFMFLLCWGPFYIIIFLINNFQLFQNILSNPIISFVVVIVLPFGNSCCNPVIYAFGDKEYQRAFKKIFKNGILFQTPNSSLHASY